MKKDYISLDEAGERLVHALGGHWRHSSGMCRCPAHADHRPSLSVRVGRTNLLFKCFAGCRSIDIARAVAAIDGLALRKGYGPDLTDNQASHIQHVQRLWISSRPLDGSPAEEYLVNRSIHIRSSALRFHPRTPLRCGSALHFKPALLSAVTEGAELVAVQRLFLDPDCDDVSCKLQGRRRLLGRPGRGSVQLGIPRDRLGLAEGIETALSATQILGFPVWAALGCERLARVAVPPTVSRLILLGDNDLAGLRGVSAAVAAHARPGLVIKTLWPLRRYKDWNDQLRDEKRCVEVNGGCRA